ncbi:MAG: hypothetical protein H6624_07665 [Bdellovibrionaceae bacterium]|nr:hypothetical protein [Bdellovibrionales bacterium]MCB9084207.1 hypothetical protein [Pseudobdellovibrionaceae bacterium]
MTTTANHPKSAPAKQENPFVSIFFNILLPVIILNQLTKRLGENGPTIALIIALAFPVAYALWDWQTRHHKNYISLLGVVNILLTGGLALLKLEGIWFAVKEAAFPLVLGIGVMGSAFTRKPLMKVITYNLHVLDMPKVDTRLRELQHEKQFARHLRLSTHLFASSFFLSSLLNFVLAARIFTEIDRALPELERSAILNDQIAQMTWLGFVVIALPLMGFSMVIMWHLLAGIRKLTGLPLAEILPTEVDPSQQS